MNEKNRNKPSVLEAQEVINATQETLDTVYAEYDNGTISYETLEDTEQILAIRRARAERLREEAIDRQTGRHLSLRTRFNRKVTKFLFG